MTQPGNVSEHAGTRAEPTSLSADALLDLTIAEPERLFARSAETARRQWRELSSLWHPDRNSDPRASWVFGHVQDLYQSATRKLEEGLWDDGRVLHIETREGRQFRLHYLSRHALDVGGVYVGRRVLAYRLGTPFTDLAERGCSLIEGLSFSDSRMREEMARQLPGTSRLLPCRAGTVLVLEKPDELVALRDLLTLTGGTLEPRHLAWVVSGLLNLCCYLETAGLAHQAIDIDHLLVGPQRHLVALTGGWWYASLQDRPWQALPARSVRLAPPDVRSRGLADLRLDQFLVRATALELLGAELNRAPRAMHHFLTMPPAHSAITDYERWQHTLWESFGERRFTPLGIRPDDIYKMTS